MGHQTKNVQLLTNHSLFFKKITRETHSFCEKSPKISFYDRQTEKTGEVSNPNSPEKWLLKPVVVVVIKGEHICSLLFEICIIRQ